MNNQNEKESLRSRLWDARDQNSAILVLKAFSSVVTVVIFFKENLPKIAEKMPNSMKKYTQ